MDLSFFPLTLEAIDEAAAESLCLFIASDERPLTGLAGLADWRLSGRLSRLLRSGVLSGEAGEAVLTPPGVRLPFQKLFLFGIGASDQSDESLVQHVAEALRKLAHAGVREAAMQLPARLSPEVGVRTLIDELQGPDRAMLFAADPQRLVSALSQAASRSSPPPDARRVVKVPTSPGMAPVKVPAPPVRVQPRAPVLPTPPDVPKASPLPSAPLPAAPLPEAPPPAAEIPKASPLPLAPEVPIAPVAEPTPAPPLGAAPVEPPAPSPSPPPPGGPQLKPPPPPPQRYVPPPPKPHVFERGKRKKP